MPEGKGTYDLIVIGTGNAGMAMALTARHAGWKVAIVDELPYGGTCAVKGCIPKKVLTGAAELVQKVRFAQNRGITGTIAIAWPDLIRFKRTFTDPVPLVRKELFAKEGIDAYDGHAQFRGKNTISIGTAELQARFIGIATGAIPQKLGIPGEELVRTSEDFLALETLPQRIVFIGGGFISFEFGHVASAAGSTVTILHRSRSVLKGFDPFLAGNLIRAYRDRGIQVLPDMPVVAVESVGDHLQVRAGKSGDQLFAADMVVHGAGRVPNLAALDLRAGDVAVNDRGIAINEHLQSVSNPSVYVAGDANASGIALSPVATMEGKIAARN
ncbi:MAG: NAD(P)/FAD-dependent oxidoreductase, partial [Methanomicrobiales archaeon]|nr:NAD(P)/FAD-dependent oxidoreductase [Methanomicrobiales archaeon]